MDSRNRLGKRARRGFKGYPIGTIAYYGPDDQRATKVVVGIVRREDAEPDEIETWTTDNVDARKDVAIQAAVINFITKSKVKSVGMVDRIIGCPHQEGIDYPLGESCPECPFWADRDRWTGRKISQ